MQQVIKGRVSTSTDVSVNVNGISVTEVNQVIIDKVENCWCQCRANVSDVNPALNQRFSTVSFENLIQTKWLHLATPVIQRRTAEDAEEDLMILQAAHTRSEPS